MDRRKFLHWSSFITVSAATGALAGCAGDDDDGPATDAADTSYTFPQGIASGDPRPDSIVLWTRVAGADAAVPVTVELATDEAFSQPLASAGISAEPDWDHTVRHKVTGLAPATTYYYRFVAGASTSPTGRTRTAPAEDAAVASLKFAFVSCQDWSVNHWAAFDALAEQDLDFVVHVGDYIYETVGASFQTGAVESAHAPLALPDGTALADGSRYATTLADYRTLYRSYRSDARLQALHARFPVISIWDDHEFSDDCWQDRQTYVVGDDQTPRTERRRNATQAWFEFMPADVSLDVADASFENIQIYRAFRFGTLATLLMTDERLYRADHIVPETAAGSSIGSRYFVPKSTRSAAEAAKIAAAGNALAPVSMLGDTQRAWWKAQLAASTATWKLWGNEVSLLRMQFDGTQAVAGLLTQALVAAEPALAALAAAIAQAIVADLQAATVTSASAPPGTDFPSLGALLGQAGLSATQTAAIAAQLGAQLPAAALLDQYLLNADQWDGYDAERRDMMAFVRDQGIANLVALTGDIHAFFAGPVMDDYDAEAPRPVMVDLVTAGISSNSFFSYFKNVVDEDAAFAAARPLIYTETGGTVTNTFDATLRQFNGSWMRHIDSDAQGFALVTLTPEQLICTFNKVKPLEDGKPPAAPVVGSQTRLSVQAGTPDVVVG